MCCQPHPGHPIRSSCFLASDFRSGQRVQSWVALQNCFAYEQGEARRTEIMAARLIDDIGWSTPLAPARGAATAAALGKPLGAP